MFEFYMFSLLIQYYQICYTKMEIFFIFIIIILFTDTYSKVVIYQNHLIK